MALKTVEAYNLACKAKAKLSHEAAHPNNRLRHLVSHVNLLDSLMLVLEAAAERNAQWEDPVDEDSEEDSVSDISSDADSTYSSESVSEEDVLGEDKPEPFCGDGAIPEVADNEFKTYYSSKMSGHLSPHSAFTFSPAKDRRQQCLAEAKERLKWQSSSIFKLLSRVYTKKAKI